MQRGQCQARAEKWTRGLVPFENMKKRKEQNSVSENSCSEALGVEKLDGFSVSHVPAQII